MTFNRKEMAALETAVEMADSDLANWSPDEDEQESWDSRSASVALAMKAVERESKRAAPGTLYFIAAGDDSFNMDLHVVAADIESAVRAWRRTFELEPSDKPDRVFAVKVPRRNGVIAWHGPACRQVASKESIQ